MNGYEFFTIIGFGIFLYLIIKLVATLIFGNNDKKEEFSTTDIEKIKIVLNDESNEKIDNYIYSLINKYLELYLILNGINKESYINSTEVEKIEKYIFASLKYNMSETTKNIIGLIYDISTEKKLDDLLNLKIKISVLSYITEQNTVIKD